MATSPISFAIQSSRSGHLVAKRNRNRGMSLSQSIGSSILIKLIKQHLPCFYCWLHKGSNMNNLNNHNAEIEGLSSNGSRMSATPSAPLTSQGTAIRGDATATMTITETSNPSRQNYEILNLTLQPRPSVRWYVSNSRS